MELLLPGLPFWSIHSVSKLKSAFCQTNFPLSNSSRCYVLLLPFVIARTSLVEVVHNSSSNCPVLRDFNSHNSHIFRSQLSLQQSFGNFANNGVSLFYNYIFTLLLLNLHQKEKGQTK